MCTCMRMHAHHQRHKRAQHALHCACMHADHATICRFEQQSSTAPDPAPCPTFRSPWRMPSECRCSMAHAMWCARPIATDRCVVPVLGLRNTPESSAARREPCVRRAQGCGWAERAAREQALGFESASWQSEPLLDAGATSPTPPQGRPLIILRSTQGAPQPCLPVRHSCWRTRRPGSQAATLPAGCQGLAPPGPAHSTHHLAVLPHKPQVPRHHRQPARRAAAAAAAAGVARVAVAAAARGRVAVAAQAAGPGGGLDVVDGDGLEHVSVDLAAAVEQGVGAALRGCGVAWVPHGMGVARRGCGIAWVWHVMCGYTPPRRG